jgi:hypothetical protein
VSPITPIMSPGFSYISCVSCYDSVAHVSHAMTVWLMCLVL